MRNAEINATPLKNNKWRVTPSGTSGTSGTLANGVQWAAIYIEATSETNAIKKAKAFANSSGSPIYDWINS